MPTFRTTLPEDQLSEKERDERARILAQFAKRLRKEIKTADLEDRIAIRRLLVYVGKRLDLLDVENRYGRAFKRFDFLLGHTTKPVPQGLLGVAADTTLNLGLKDTERLMRRHEARTASLIAEISMLAPEIDKLLDQRPSSDQENFMLRPSSCLPEAAMSDEHASSGSGNTPDLHERDSPDTDKLGEPLEVGEQNAIGAGPIGTMSADTGRDKDRSDLGKGKTPKPNPAPQPDLDEPNRDWLEPRKLTIKVHGKPYGRNHLADKMMQVDYFTERQRDVAVLCYGYDMRDAVISTLLHCNPKTVYGHRKGAESKLARDPEMQILLRNYKRKSR